MRTTIRTVLFSSLLVASLAAAAEVQVPLDRAGRVQRVDAALARRLGIFPDRPGFQEARLFQLGSGGSDKVLWATSAAGTVVGYAVGYSMYAKIAHRAGPIARRGGST
jgi:hypothetical protein